MCKSIDRIEFSYSYVIANITLGILAAGIAIARFGPYAL